MDFDVFNLPTGTEIAYGKNLYILGTAEDGPLLEPILISTQEQLYKVFGKTGSLITAWQEAYQVATSSINIRLMRVSGSVAERGILQYITLTSKGAGKKYNDIYFSVHSTGIEICEPLELGGRRYSFSFQTYPRIGQLTQAINTLTRQGDFNVWATTNTPMEDIERIPLVFEMSGTLDTKVYLEEGSDGIDISKNELHECLDIAYNILEGQPVDILCLAEAYFDDVSPLAYYGENGGYAQAFYTADRDYLTKAHATVDKRTVTFHGQLIDFCYRQLNSSIVTHGVLGFNPLENVEDIFEKQAYLNKALFASCFSDGFDLRDKSGDDVTDHGRFVSVVMGELVYKDTDGLSYYNNGYAGYAAMLCMYLTPEAMTNKLVPNISEIRYHLEDDEINILSKLGVVTFRYSLYKKGIVVSNGVTAELSTSPYHSVSNTRMVQMTMAYFKVLLDEYVGQNVLQLKRSKAIEKAIEELIKTLRSSGIVQDIRYQFNLSDSGFATVNLNILAIYAVEYVDATGTTKL